MGLRELLEKKTEIKEVFLNRKDLNIEEDIPFFAILGGKPVNDGSRLLGSREMESLIRALKNSVDYMILDSAPAGLLTDAGVLAPVRGYCRVRGKAGLCQSGYHHGRD